MKAAFRAASILGGPTRFAPRATTVKPIARETFGKVFRARAAGLFFDRAHLLTPSSNLMFFRSLFDGTLSGLIDLMNSRLPFQLGHAVSS